MELMERITSDEPKDLTTIRDWMVDPSVERAIAILLDGEIRVTDIDYLLGKVALSLNHHLEQANTLLWGKDLFKRTLADIQEVLKHAGTNDNRTADK